MDLSLLATKGALIKGAGSLVVLSGASVGGYYIYESSFSAPKGNHINSSPKINLEIRNDAWHHIDKQPCFYKYFGNLGTDFYSSQEDSSTFDKPFSTGSSDPEGCVTMRLSENPNNVNEYVFESESTVKNDKIGILLKLEANTIKKDNLRYSVLFLEKENTEWKIKGGFIAKRLNGRSISLKSPDNTTINKTFPNTSANSSLGQVQWTHKHYYGIWEKEDKGNDPLLKYKFEPADDTDGNTIFGNKISSSFIYSVYKSSFAEWYKPFENKKGKWNKKPEIDSKS